MIAMLLAREQRLDGNFLKEERHMGNFKRFGLIAIVFIVAGFSTGCNLLSLPFFIFGPEPRTEPEMKQIGSKERRDEVTVVVLTYAGPETRPEFIKVDRDLAACIAHQMREAFKYNDEKVKVISPSKVEKFKQDHLNWQTMELADIGKYFAAEYLVYVELDNDTLALYERGSGRELFRGHADYTVTLVNVHEPEDGTDRKQFSYSYPSEAKGPIHASDTTLILFKQKFLDQIAKKVAWCVTSHPTKDGYVEE
jgi:hypothetical protein